MTMIQIVISVEDVYFDRWLEVVSNLQAAGMQVEQQMVAIGVITGSIDSNSIHTITQIAGVAAVEQSETYQIAPPHSDIQ